MREIAELLEDQLGLVRGWLMSVPSKVRERDCSLDTALLPAHVCLVISAKPVMLPKAQYIDAASIPSIILSH